MAQLDLTYQVGHLACSTTRRNSRTAAWELLFGFDGYDLPFVSGCSAWLACRVIPRTTQRARPYDLFIAEIEAAWSNTRVFRDGRWRFETADPTLHSLHHIAGGHFYAIGEPHGCWRRHAGLSAEASLNHGVAHES